TGAVKQRLHVLELIGEEKPSPGPDRPNLDQARAIIVDLAALVIDHFMCHVGLATERSGSPFFRQLGRLLRVAPATKSAIPFPRAGLDRDQREEGVLHFDRRNLINGLSDSSLRRNA